MKRSLKSLNLQINCPSRGQRGRECPLWLAWWLVVALPLMGLETTFLITEDTYLDSRPADQQRNFGLNGSVRVLVNSDGSVTRGLFALPPALRVYRSEEILSAKVFLYVFQDNTQARSIRLHPLSKPFIEGTGGSGPSATGATWFTSDGTNQWTNPGGDYDAGHWVESVKGPVLDPNLNDRFFSWDLTPLLTNAWTRSNLLHNGALLIMEGEDAPPAASSDRAPFTSAENTSNPPEYRPRVVVQLRPREPVLRLMRRGPEELQIHIANAMPYLALRVERAEDLKPPVVWTEVTTVAATSSETNVVDTLPGVGTKAFYRVVVLP